MKSLQPASFPTVWDVRSNLMGLQVEMVRVNPEGWDGVKQLPCALPLPLALDKVFCR